MKIPQLKTCSMEKIEPSLIRFKKNVPHSALLFTVVLEGLAKQEKEIKCIQAGKEELKPSVL